MIQAVSEKFNSKLTISFIVCVTAIIILTYFGTRWIYKDINYDTLIHRTVDNDTYKFTYSNQLLFNAVIDARRKNCLNYNNNYYKFSVDGNICNMRYKCNSFRPNAGLNSSVSSKEVFNQEGDHLPEGCSKRFPGAIIIGVFKSGTRAIIDFLYMNPDVVIKRDSIQSYEISYFDKFADKGDEWYKEQMPYSLDDQLTVEKSPSYFTSIQAPRRIHDFNSDMRLILILRDPIERVLSHLTFEKFLIEKHYENNVNNCLFKYDPLRNRTVLNKKCFAVKYSVYDEPMERYLNYFSLEHIFIIDGSEFMTSPCRVLKQIEKFLKVKNYVNCEDFVYNEDKKIFCIRNQEKNKPAACYGRTRGRSRELSSKFETIREHFRPYFKPHNERFFSLIGRKFDWT